jgi:hypothetical protein
LYSEKGKGSNYKHYQGAKRIRGLLSYPEAVAEGTVLKKIREAILQRFTCSVRDKWGG